MLAWHKYLAIVEKQVGKVIYASWRNKRTGWHDSWAMAIDGEEKCGDKVDWHDSYNMLIRGKKVFLIQGFLRVTCFISSFWDIIV